MTKFSEKVTSLAARRLLAVVCLTAVALVCSFNIFSETPRQPNRPVKPSHRTTSPVTSPELPDSIPFDASTEHPEYVIVDSISAAADSLAMTPLELVKVVPDAKATPAAPVYTFNPDPTRAVWMSALFPGLGQLYNRRYWKLPIVIGAFMGLGYATSWNTTMLSDYTTAYADIMDNDPTTKSYMDFFPPTVKEDQLDKTWLTSLLRQRKNYYRRNRDLCILCIVGMYLVAMVDSYVDAQLAHFDISPNLSVDLAPTLMESDMRSRLSKPGIGVYWAINF